MRSQQLCYGLLAGREVPDLGIQLFNQASLKFSCWEIMLNGVIFAKGSQHHCPVCVYWFQCKHNERGLWDHYLNTQCTQVASSADTPGVWQASFSALQEAGC